MLPSPFATTLAATTLAGATRPTAMSRCAQVSHVLRSGAKLLVLACGALSAATAGAAGRSDLSQVVREPSVAERSVRAQEMRRQLLEHQRYWRGNAANSPAPSLRDMPPASPMSPGAAVTSPGSVVPLGTTPIGTTPLGAPIGAPSLRGSFPEAALPAIPMIPIGITPVGTPAAAPSISDSRLTDRERDLLRQQLRQLPYVRSPRGNPADTLPVR